jgi:hypothetical protein
MNVKRLIALMLALVLTATCIPCSWADGASPSKSEPSGGAVAAAVVSDIIYIPGKACTCVIGAGLWTAAMALTFGTIYKEAGKFVQGCCGGKWVVTGNDMVDKE